MLFFFPPTATKEERGDDKRVEAKVLAGSRGSQKDGGGTQEAIRIGSVAAYV